MAYSPQRAFLIRAFGAVFAVTLLAACDHSAPAGIVNYGAVGPRVPGPEARIDGAGSDAGWTEDGRGILYTGTCLARNSSPGRPEIPGIMLLPAAGGSSTWEMCEADKTLKNPAPAFPGDSATAIMAAALGADGRLLYVECAWIHFPNDLHPTDINCGNAGQMVMWLGDSAWPFTRRRKVANLVHIIAGVPVDSTVLNNVSNVAWVGPAAFIARGFNSTPFQGARFQGVVYGTTDGANPALAIVPGTAAVRAYSTAENAATLVFSRDSLVVERMPLRGGSAQAIVALPKIPGRFISQISCRNATCLLLSQESGATATQSTFWLLNLAGGDLVMLRSYPFPIATALLSPVSNAVLVGQSDGVHLLTDLVP